MLPGELQWLTTTQMAALKLPGIPPTQQGCDALARRSGWLAPEQEGRWWRKREGRGGGIEFFWVILPETARLKLACDYGAEELELSEEEQKSAAAWAWFVRLSGAKQDEAKQRLQAVHALDALIRSGTRRTMAAQLVAREHKVGLASLYRWRDAVAGVHGSDWLPALAPRHIGRPGKADMPEDAWQLFLADFMRPEMPALSDCYRRVHDVAEARGWTIPCERTFLRRVDDIPLAVRTYAREGREAAQRLFPAQTRDRRMLRALEAVNLDGHRWDVFVRWADGKIERPQMLAVQDLYSGAILAWRVDRTLHKGLVRLAIGDVVEQWGVPEHCYMDNGRENAAKWITGGVPNRYRFKVRDEDPIGLLPQLGIGVHFTTPYSGQSKPIERAFRDFAGSIAKHPAFAGAYVGHKPDAKPENYGNAAVPIEVFLRVVGREIAAHNARPGRRTLVCDGKLSFAQALESSLKLWPVRRTTADQRRLWLLAAEGVRVSRVDGSVELEGNRYWHEKLHPFCGQRLVARFDPDVLHADLHLYTPGGDYVVAAACVQPVGFRDVEAARRHAQLRGSYLRATREALKAERQMSVAEAAAVFAELEKDAPPELPEPKIIRPFFGQAARKLEPDDEETESDRLLLRFAEMRRAELKAVDSGDD